MGGPQDRRAPRVPAEVHVHIVGAKGGQVDFITTNVSRGGVFIRTDEPKPLRQLLRLRVKFAGPADSIEVHGMVVHTTSPGEAAQTGELPGMGIEFIAFGGAPRERWETFLRQVSGTQPGHYNSASQIGSNPWEHQSPAIQQAPIPMGQTAMGSHQSTIQDPVTSAQSSQPQILDPELVSQRQKKPDPRRKLVRTVFPIPLEAVDQLYEIYERDLVAGVMFVCTPEQLGIGDRVAMRIIHPINLEEFDLHGKVQQLHDNPQYPGLSVALRPSTIARREKFRAFIEAGLPEEDLAVDLIDD